MLVPITLQRSTAHSCSPVMPLNICLQIVLDTFCLNCSKHLHSHQNENWDLMKEETKIMYNSFLSTEVFPHFTEIHHIPPSKRPANLKAVFLSRARNAVGYAQ